GGPGNGSERPATYGCLQTTAPPTGCCRSPDGRMPVRLRRGRSPQGRSRPDAYRFTPAHGHETDPQPGNWQPATGNRASAYNRHAQPRLVPPPDRSLRPRAARRGRAATLDRPRGEVALAPTGGRGAV